MSVVGLLESCGGTIPGRSHWRVDQQGWGQPGKYRLPFPRVGLQVHSQDLGRGSLLIQ